MKIEEIAQLLNARIHCIPEGYNKDITHAGASDLMSDVLAYVDQDILLVTGLVGPQVIRTISLMDISAVVFTRGKIPGDDMIEEASKAGIAVLSTDLKSYTTSGILYSSGIHGIEEDT
jgi:predicted transcriptional regulator